MIRPIPVLIGPMHALMPHPRSCHLVPIANDLAMYGLTIGGTEQHFCKFQENKTNENIWLMKVSGFFGDEHAEYKSRDLKFSIFNKAYDANYALRFANLCCNEIYMLLAA